MRVVSLAVLAGTLMFQQPAFKLMIPGRAKDNADWMKKAEALVDVGVKAMKAAEAKDPDAVVKIGWIWRWSFRKVTIYGKYFVL